MITPGTEGDAMPQDLTQALAAITATYQAERDVMLDSLKTTLEEISARFDTQLRLQGFRRLAPIDPGMVTVPAEDILVYQQRIAGLIRGDLDEDPIELLMDIEAWLGRAGGPQ